MLTLEPTPEELAAISDEWPLIAAELAVVAAECHLAASSHVLSVRAHRRAVAALSVVARQRATYLRSVHNPTAA